jgi:divalent metal cation (Fe/Co/Zn/Cd) transporter
VATLSKERTVRRERTLLAALLLSLWAPLATGVAVALSRSNTQLADFVRRTVELIALLISWLTFRYLARRPALDGARRARVERLAGLSVGAAMVCSGVVISAVALSRLSTFQPGGNIYLGLTIAGLGLLTNAWFWRRYSVLNREQYSAIIAAQRRLYRAKAFVDLCVIAGLAAVAIDPTHPFTRWVDVLGSVIVGAYLGWSGLRAARAQPGGP